MRLFFEGTDWRTTLGIITAVRASVGTTMLQSGFESTIDERGMLELLELPREVGTQPRRGELLALICHPTGELLRPRIGTRHEWGPLFAFDLNALDWAITFDCGVMIGYRSEESRNELWLFWEEPTVNIVKMLYRFAATFDSKMIIGCSPVQVRFGCDEDESHGRTLRRVWVEPQDDVLPVRRQLLPFVSELALLSLAHCGRMSGLTMSSSIFPSM